MASAVVTPQPFGMLKIKLAMMMFFQFFIWGAWFELSFAYIGTLGFQEWQETLIFVAFNFGALVALFFSTQFADRNFAAERFLAFSHLVGGLAIMGLFFIRKDPTTGSAAFWPFFLLMLVHSIFYVPTISITNSIAFANLQDPANEFGPVRVWGTIGWIAASWPFIFILAVDAAPDSKRYIFLVAGLASLVLAAFSMFLPHTPPKPATSGGDTLAWLKAVKLLKHPFVAVLFLVTFIDAAVHQSYYNWTATYLGPIAEKGVIDLQAKWVQPVMKIGQVAEIVTMLFLGYVLKRLGWRWTMAIGILGHATRFAVFAFLPYEIPAILINAVHGICFAFFFATVYLFVDEFFPTDIRSSAQGLFNLLFLGVGPFAANLICGRLKTIYSDPTGRVDYSIVYQYSMFAALVGGLLLLLFFHPPPRKAPEPSFSKVEEDAPAVP